MSFKQKLSSYVLILIFFLTNFDTVLAQTKKIDSLTKVLNSHPQKDDIRGKILFDLAAQNFQYDARSALKYVDEIISIEDKIINQNIVSAGYRVKGMVNFHLSQYREALLYLNKIGRAHV